MYYVGTLRSFVALNLAPLEPVPVWTALDCCLNITLYKKASQHSPLSELCRLCFHMGSRSLYEPSPTGLWWTTYLLAHESQLDDNLFLFTIITNQWTDRWMRKCRGRATLGCPSPQKKCSHICWLPYWLQVDSLEPEQRSILFEVACWPSV